MQCTEEQIAAKRRAAEEKISAKRSFQTFKSEGSSPGTSSPYKFYRGRSHETTSPYKKVESTTSRPNVSSCSLKFVLVSYARFQTEMSTFHTGVIDVFKTISSRNYDAKGRMWSFAMDDYSLLLNKLVKMEDVTVERFPNFVLKIVKEYPQVELDSTRVDRELYETLLPFQIEGLKFAVQRQGSCLIADDMGLGKTFQALAIASYYREDWPLLIVTTASMKNVWEQTIHEHMPSVSVFDIKYMSSGKDYINDAKILIVSHDLMARCLDQLKERGFGVIIIDESHNLKNSKAKCTKAAAILADLARRTILLSGTPALSRPSELYSQLSLIDGLFFGNFFVYSKRYCDGKSGPFGWDASGKSNLGELELVLKRKFMIRRTKDEVLRSLPDKKQEIVHLEVACSDQQKEILSQMAQSLDKKKKDHSLLLVFFAETAKIKMPAVCSYIKTLLESDQRKFLVFAHHQVMLDGLEKVLRDKDVGFIRIDGTTSSTNRLNFVEKFQIKPNCRCALLSITAANAGITLTAADLVIFAELHWNPSILSQAEARAHRIGQQQCVIVRYLLSKGTSDDSVWPMIQNKQKILSEVGLLKDNFDNATISNVRVDLQESSSNSTRHNNSKITDFFNASFEEKPEEVEDVFDDGMDDIFSNIDM